MMFRHNGHNDKSIGGEGFDSDHTSNDHDDGGGTGRYECCESSAALTRKTGL